MDGEIQTFMNAALSTFEKHHYRWLTSLVDLTAFFPKKEVAVAMARGLLAVWDGADLPEVPEAEKKQVIFGRAVDLGGLVRTVLQFATPGVLSETRFFSCPESIADLRRFVDNGGEFKEDSGARLQRKVKSFVFGLPIHSHAAEWTVNAGSGLVQKGAPHTSQVKLCGLLATILDEVRVFEREARHEYKKIQEEKGQMPKWSFDCRGVYREVRPVMYNKAIFKLHATSLDKKVMRITPEIETEALSKQRIDRSNGNTRKQQRDKHKEAKVEGWEKKRKQRDDNPRVQKQTEAQLARRVALCNPERIDRNIIGRSEETSLSKEEIAAELENRGLEVKRANTGKKEGSVCGTVKRADLFQQLIEWHDNRELNSSGNFGDPGGKIPRKVPKGGREKRKWASLNSSTAV